MDWDKYAEDVDSRERKNREDFAAAEKIANCSYIGEWGYGEHKLHSGIEISHGDLWVFTTRYKYMCKLSNLPDPDGKCLVGWGAKKLQRCLELGCDWGHCFPVFEHFFEEVCGVEIMASTAQAGVDAGQNIIHCPMEHTPYPDCHFDVVLSNHVLEHGLSPDISIAEIFRVTKPGGWSVHTLPVRVDKLKEPESVIHKSILDYEEWNQVFIKHGFCIERGYFSWNHNQEEWNIIARRLE